MSLRAWARALKRDSIAVWLAARDPRVPALAKIMAFVTTAYALSPIDLIPDFIPVLGYLDDLLIVPLGLWLVIKLIDPALLAELRLRAAEIAERPTSRGAAATIVLIWLATVAVLGRWLYGVAY